MKTSSLAIALALAVAAGGAAALRAEEVEPADAAPPPRQQAFNARAWVSRQETAPECEASARALRHSNPQSAWEALRACIEVGRFSRGPFTQIALLTAYWEEELRSRPDAARVVGQVIANRGGDADDDISRLQKVRMPVFTLGAAMKQPDVYKGRWVILRARLFDVKMDARSATAMLAETSMNSAEGLRNSGDVYVSSYSRSGTYNGSSTGSGDLARRSRSVSPPPSRFDWARTSASAGLVRVLELTSTTSSSEAVMPRSASGSLK